MINTSTRLFRWMIVLLCLLSACNLPSRSLPAEPTPTDTPVAGPAPTSAGITTQPPTLAPPGNQSPSEPTRESVIAAIEYANQRYALALKEVDSSLLDDSWHDGERQNQEQTVQQLRNDNHYRTTEFNVEVTSVYFVNEKMAIAKAIETWQAQEFDRSTNQVVQNEDTGILFKTYSLEVVGDHWSIFRVDFCDCAALTLTGIQGDVFLNGEPVSDQSEISQGDEIVTGHGASAILVYPFDGTTEIREDGHLMLTTLEIDPDPNNPRRGHVEIELFGTSLWNKLQKVWRSIFRANGMVVEDDPAEFGVTLADDGGLILEVQAGEVKLTTDSGEVVVTGGQQSIAYPDSAPASPVPWPGPLLTPGINLVVGVLEVSGDPYFSSKEDIVVPLHVVVRNLGSEPADIFKLSAELSSPGGTYTVAFTVPDRQEGYYPFTSEPLPPGGEVAFDGEVTLPGSLARSRVTLTVTADSCLGEEFAADFCRVPESNEEDNQSTIEIQLP
jgi:hypothetical protein